MTNSGMRAIFVFLSIVIFATNGFSQISSAGTYLGKIGGNDIAVGVNHGGSVYVYLFDKTLRRLESASGILAADGAAVLTTRYGRPVTVMLDRSQASGTFAGAAFTAAIETPYGPNASKALNFSGTAVDAPRGLFSLVQLVSYASGKALLIYSSNAGGDSQGGIGTITTSGAVTVAMTTGVTWSFLLNPIDGLAIGGISSPGASPIPFILTEAQRAPLINLATRGTVGGGSILTAGFVTRSSTKTLLIRAVGPTLAAFGIQNAQPDPILTLYSGSRIIALNNDWGTAANFSDVSLAASQAGAFALASGSLDAVLLVTLEPGAYTAQVSANGTAVGDALVEVYEIQ